MDLLQPVIIGGAPELTPIAVDEFENYFRAVLLFEYYAIELQQKNESEDQYCLYMPDNDDIVCTTLHKFIHRIPKDWKFVPYTTNVLE